MNKDSGRSIIEAFFARKAYKIRNLVTDDVKRRYQFFVWTNAICAMLAAFMTVVNIATAKWTLMTATFSYTILCVINLVICSISDKAKSFARIVFCTETIILCSFFCVSGAAEGFTVLWCCLIPLMSFLFLRFRYAVLVCVIEFIVLVILFWIPAGRTLLRYSYPDSFLLRFPLFYLTFFLISMYEEFLRFETNWQLKEDRRNYHNQYRFDTLTGILNKNGFDEKLDAVFNKSSAKTVSLIVIQLDYLKHINDTFGRDSGDRLLRAVADRIATLGGEGSVACRWDGVSFALMLLDCPNPEDVGNNIRSEISKLRLVVPSGQVGVTTTVGVSTIANDELGTPGRLVRSAQTCLYRAVNAGRNQLKSERL